MKIEVYLILLSCILVTLNYSYSESTLRLFPIAITSQHLIKGIIGPYFVWTDIQFEYPNALVTGFHGKLHSALCLANTLPKQA